MHHTRAVWFVLAALSLSGFSILVGSRYPLPVAGNMQYAILPQIGTLIWFQRFDIPEENLHQLDLKTGTVSRVGSDQFGPIGQRTERGLVISLDRQIVVKDERTGKVLYKPDWLSSYKLLIGDRYIVSPDTDKIAVLDLDDVLGLPNTQGRTSSGEVISLSFRAKVPGGDREDRYGPTSLYPIDGSPRFLYHFKDPTSPRIGVFEIRDRSARELASWPTTVDTVVVQHGDKVFTAAPGAAAVQVHSLADFQLLQAYPLPKGLKAWKDFQSRNGVFTFDHLNAGVIDAYHLEDFTPLPPVNMPVSRGGYKTSYADDRRYALLCPNPTRSDRIVVYDSVARKIVVDRAPLLCTEDIQIIDSQLVMCNAHMGLTVELVDLKTGISRFWQPYIWHLVALPIILSLALVWIILWLKHPEFWPKYAIMNVLFLTGLFVAPQLIHAAQYGGFIYLYRPAIGYCYMTALALLTCLVFVISSSRQRVLVRLAMACLTLAAIQSLANWLELNGSTQENAVHQISLQILMAYVLVAMFFFFSVKLIVTKLFKSRQGAEPSVDTAPALPLRDAFLFTACAATLTAAASRNLSFFWNSNVLGTLVFAGFLMLPGSIGLLGMRRPSRIAKPLGWLVLLIAILLIAEITVHMMLGEYQIYVGFLALIYVRYYLFLLVATYALARVIKGQVAT